MKLRLKVYLYCEFIVISEDITGAVGGFASISAANSVVRGLARTAAPFVSEGKNG